MKLRLRRHETRETLKLELSDTGTLHDLRLLINTSNPLSVHLSLNRKDELIAPSPADTLRSLGVTSGDLIYYSLDHSAFVASVQEIGLASSSEGYQDLVPGGESSNAKLGECVTIDPIGIGSAEVDVIPDLNMDIQDHAKFDLNSTVDDPAEGSSGGNSGLQDADPMDIDQFDVELAAAGSKRLSEPFFLKNILREKCGDTSELTTLAMSIHAVMLESGLLLFDHGSDKFRFSKELLSVSLRYTLPELITRKDTDTIESVTVKFQSLGSMVVVYGSLGGSSGRVHRVNIDKRRFVPVIDLVMDTLKSDKEGSSGIYTEVFKFWRMVKDGLVIPLLIGLCEKSGLELPPCLMRLPTELKLKILESLPGVSIAKMACLCTEMRYLASDNDLWKLKCLEVGKTLVETEVSDSVNWKAKFATFWRQHQRVFPLERRNFHMRRSAMRFPRVIRDPYTWLNGDRFQGGVGIHPGHPGWGPGRRAWGLNFHPRCNHGGLE